MRRNGSIRGKTNTPTTSTANGIFSLSEVFQHQKDGVWPFPASYWTTSGFSFPFSNGEYWNPSTAYGGSNVCWQLNLSVFDWEFDSDSQEGYTIEPPNIFTLVSISSGQTISYSNIYDQIDSNLSYFGGKVDRNYNTIRLRYKNTGAWFATPVRLIWGIVETSVPSYSMTTYQGSSRNIVTDGPNSTVFSVNSPTPRTQTAYVNTSGGAGVLNDANQPYSTMLAALNELDAACPSGMVTLVAQSANIPGAQIPSSLANRILLTADTSGKGFGTSGSPVSRHPSSDAHIRVGGGITLYFDRTVNSYFYHDMDMDSSATCYLNIDGLSAASSGSNGSDDTQYGNAGSNGSDDEYPGNGNSGDSAYAYGGNGGNGNSGSGGPLIEVWGSSFYCSSINLNGQDGGNGGHGGSATAYGGTGGNGGNATGPSDANGGDGGGGGDGWAYAGSGGNGGDGGSGGALHLWQNPGYSSILYSGGAGGSGGSAGGESAYGGSGGSGGSGYGSGVTGNPGYNATGYTGGSAYNGSSGSSGSTGYLINH